DDFIGELRHGHVATSNALKVIDAEFRGIDYRLAILRELLPGRHDVAHLALRQTNQRAAVPLQQGSLSQRFGFSLGARLEKFAPFLECTKIKDEFVFWVMTIRQNFQRRFHAKNDLYESTRSQHKTSLASYFVRKFGILSDLHR